MKARLLIAAVAAAAVATAAPAAQAAPPDLDPCATQRALFEKYNIELGMYSPELSYAYNAVCSVTG